MKKNKKRKAKKRAPALITKGPQISKQNLKDKKNKSLIKENTSDSFSALIQKEVQEGSHVETTTNTTHAIELEKNEVENPKIKEVRDNHIENLEVKNELAITKEEEAEDPLSVQLCQKNLMRNPKALREQAKEKGLSRKTILNQGAVLQENKPLLKLKAKHTDNLIKILKAAAHPPTWSDAVKAVSKIIKQWGGSIRGDLGKGTAVEFWINRTRFLVDSTHGNDLMYRAQMKFMAKGLKRAGITLDLLNKLE